MELNEYIRLFRKWLWLFALAAFLAGGVSFVIRSRLAPVYRAQTTLSIGNFIRSPDPSAGEIQTGIQLAQTYAELARTFNVLQGTVEMLDLPFSADALRGMISTRILPQTSLLVLNIEHTDPILTADIANELANQLIVNSPTNLTVGQQSQIDLANEQIDSLTNEIDGLRAQLSVVDGQIATATAQDEIERLTQRRNDLVIQINQAASTIAQFSDTVASLQQRTNSVDVVESARIPTSPTGSNIVNTTLLGAIVGATLAGGVVLLIEYLDDTIRTSEDAAQTMALPVLAAIMRFGKTKDSYPERLITNYPLSSPVSEGYRSLRTNLLFASNREADHAGPAVYLVTSAGPTEGKSITAANLGVTMANAGLRVLLIDADLRRPTIHQILSLKNEIGFTTLLSGYPSRNGAAQDDREAVTRALAEQYAECVQRTSISRLSVITSGFTPQNPTEVLGSSIAKRWIDGFRSMQKVDVIIFDTPPALVTADGAVLAKTADADVILVLEAGKTRRATAQKVKEQFEQLGCDIKGVVLNRANPRDEEYYGYGYYYSYYGSADSEANGGQRRGLRRWLS